MKILIVDDQVLLRKSIGQLISTDDSITVVDMVGNGQAAIDACEFYKPDIVLMDIEMPIMDGISALKIIKEKYPIIKVIILTTFDNSNHIIDSFVAEADGYVVKDIDCEELIATIKCVSYGLTVIHESVKRIMIDKFKKMNSHKSYEEILSKEEIDIVKHIVVGNSNKEIATKFNYSEGTIKNKVSKIYEKLNINDRLQLAVFAVENGIE